MDIAVFQVDAFTTEPFKGNPAAVCLLQQAEDEVWMQAVAAEMNLSETAFVLKEGDGFRLRWFTPKTEVKLCGHATLATAHILFEQGILKTAEQARFHTLSGLLTADYREGLIELNFPASPVIPCEAPDGLLEALGVQAKFIARSDDDYLIEVDDEKTIRRLSPNYAQLVGVRCRGIIVTALSRSDGYDFISRFFAPAVGINEDPVTGSAHCRLTPYWQAKLGKNEFTAYQASARGGYLSLKAEVDRVRIGGRAVTILQGKLLR